MSEVSKVLTRYVLAGFVGDAFPTKEVYSNTRKSSLAPITCGGKFDHSSRHYVDNVISLQAWRNDDPQT